MSSLEWAYLISYRFVGIFWKRLVAAGRSGGGFLLLRRRANNYRGVSIEPDFPTPIPIRLQWALRTSLSRKFQDLRAVVMTINERAQAAIPHQDRRSLSCPAWFPSPRGITCTTQLCREMKSIRRISHGNARSIESLRELRLPLVPASNSRECILQRMSNKAERIPIAGKS